MKFVNFDATRCRILPLKCVKVDFGWGSAPDPGELTAVFKTTSCVKRAYISKGMRDEGKGFGRGKTEGKAREAQGM